MNERPTLLKPVGPESLAGEHDFQLGEISVWPSLREVRAGDKHEILEPRVMQVLVALSRANGAVVSRDELIRQCWGGRIVGEDAINRCVSKIRQLSDFGGSTSFEIETIPRVGYRLLRAPAKELSQPQHAIIVQPQALAALAEPRPISIWRRIGRSGRITLLMVLAIVTAIAAAWSFAPRAEREWRVVESHMPFISTPLAERAPDISPNGSMLAYSAGPDYLHRSIYLRLLSGGEPLRLVGPPLSGYSPVWSPDDSQIAFYLFTPGKSCRIMLVAALGGKPREVGRCSSADLPTLAWDRTNTGILFNDSPSAGVPGAIYRLDLNEGRTQQLTHPIRGASVQDDKATISPDGTTLAFRREMNWEKSDIRLRTLATGVERVLLAGSDGENNVFAWSNDSKVLFIARNISWGASLWAYPVDGSAPQRIIDSPMQIPWLSSGPDGLLAMTLERSERDIAAAPASGGQAVTVLDANDSGAFSFAYSKDGTLAAIAPRSGATSLLIAGKDGALHELLRLKGSLGGALRWSPDGTRLAFIERGEPDFQITIADRQGRILQRISYRALEMDWLDWDNDGKSLILTSLDSRGWRARRVHFSNPARRPEPVAPYGWRHVTLRGEIMLGVKDGADGIWRIDGTTPKQLTNWPSRKLPWLWTATDDRIVYPDFSNPDAPVFLAIPLTGGMPQPVGYPASMSRGATLALNPRTGLVTYMRLKRFDADIGWLRLARR